MEFGEFLDDGQTEPQPSMLAGDRAVRLPESVEHVRQKRLGYSYAGVADVQFQQVAGDRETQGHSTRRGRERDGVREQIPHHLLKPDTIAAHDTRLGWRVDGQLDALRLRGWADVIDTALDDIPEIDRLEGEAHLSRNDTRDVDEVIDDPRLNLRVPRDPREGVCRGLFVDRGRRENLDPAEDRVQRRPELVRHGGQELVLQAADLAFANQKTLSLSFLATQPLVGLDQAGVRFVHAPEHLCERPHQVSNLVLTGVYVGQR